MLLSLAGNSERESRMNWQASTYYEPFHWPLWCDPDDCMIPCIVSWRFVPHAIIHLAIFYFGAAVATILKSRGIVWSDKSFSGIFDVAWHVPNLGPCVPMSLMALRAVADLWQGDDARLSWGAREHPLVTEPCVWFGTYLAVDSVLMLLHGLGDREMLVHHIIFGVVCFVMFSSCSAPLLGAALLAQEFSTPFLNVFLLLRGYRGMESPMTILAFLLFALAFYAMRVFLNSAVTFGFLKEAYASLTGPPGASELIYSPQELVPLSLVLIVAWAMQLYWGVSIAIKIQRAVAGDDEDKAKSE